MKRVVSGVLVLACLGVGQFALADGAAETKYRKSVMKSIGGHMSSMGTILKNQIHMDDLVIHARGLAGLADIAPEVFPEGSNTKKSKALPAVWENPEEFSQAMDRFIDAAEGMASAAGTEDMSEIGPAIQALGGSCKGCHDDFKAE
ncbi:MAG: cytochrome c [Pseudomonadales bacterium]|jgi:cytochrome c556|nr:cytochrome c [Gammaproteobacteria bacterium]|tara:strand:- start:5318 stop:5755 length:438 start_codon:yes stop_codon:yes gene_type:complete